MSLVDISNIDFHGLLALASEAASITVSDCDGQAAKTCCALPESLEKLRIQQVHPSSSISFRTDTNRFCQGASCGKWLQQLLICRAEFCSVESHGQKWPERLRIWSIFAVLILVVTLLVTHSADGD